MGRVEMYARSHKYLVSSNKGVENAKEWQLFFVLRKTDLCAMGGVNTEMKGRRVEEPLQMLPVS